jgi:hypothetical protein
LLTDISNGKINYTFFNRKKFKFIKRKRLFSKAAAVVVENNITASQAAVV